MVVAVAEKMPCKKSKDDANQIKRKPNIPQLKDVERKYEITRQSTPPMPSNCSSR